MKDVVSRKEWGAVTRIGEPSPLSKSATKGMAVHYADEHSASDHADCAGQVAGIQRFHMQTRGWSDIAYSFLVCRHGFIFEGRGWGVRTAAQGTDEGNTDYHAVCFISADGTTELTPEAKTAISRVILKCKELGWGSDVEPHNHFHLTDCPGHHLGHWVTNKGWLAQNTPTGGPGEGAKPPKPPRTSHHPPAWFHRDLTLLSPFERGHDVEVVQVKVGADPDGLFGPDTASRLRGWKRTHGLPDTAVVDKETAEALGELPSHGQIPLWYHRLLTRGASGQDVRHVQQRLQIAATDLYDLKTFDAVRRYQSQHKLTVDGVVGPDTATSLGD